MMMIIDWLLASKMLIDLFDFMVLRKKIDFELWKTVSNLYKCFEIKMNSFLGYSGEISNKS